jgi:hypothetical protein
LQQIATAERKAAQIQTEDNHNLFGPSRVENHKVVAAFDGGAVTSDAGGLLLGATDRRTWLISRFAVSMR